MSVVRRFRSLGWVSGFVFGSLILSEFASAKSQCSDLFYRSEVASLVRAARYQRLQDRRDGLRGAESPLRVEISDGQIINMPNRPVTSFLDLVIHHANFRVPFRLSAESDAFGWNTSRNILIVNTMAAEFAGTLIGRNGNIVRADYLGSAFDASPDGRFVATTVDLFQRKDGWFVRASLRSLKTGLVGERLKPLRFEADGTLIAVSRESRSGFSTIRRIDLQNDRVLEEALVNERFETPVFSGLGDFF